MFESIPKRVQWIVPNPKESNGRPNRHAVVPNPKESNGKPNRHAVVPNPKESNGKPNRHAKLSQRTIKK